MISQMPIATGTTNNKVTLKPKSDWFAHVGLRFPNPKRFTKISKQYIDENEGKFSVDAVNLPKYKPGFTLSATP